MTQQIEIKEDEIDLREILRYLWDGRRFIMKVTSFFFAVGFAVAFLSPVEYEASCKLMPESQESQESSLSSLGGLAGLAGINLGLGISGALTPELYPEIAKSVPFQWQLLQTEVYFENQDTTVTPYVFFSHLYTPSVFDYFTRYTIGLPNLLKSFLATTKEKQPSPDGLLRLSKKETDLLEDFSERIWVNVDNKTGVISIAAEMPDPHAAAAVANRVVKHLTSNVTDYKIEKASVNLEFITERWEESRRDFNNRQEVLATFIDNNKNLNTALAQTEFQRLQNEYNIAFEVYKGLATQLEQAKMKVKEETPVFTILEPVLVPVEKTKPKRSIILFTSVFLGIGAATIYLILKKQFC